MPGEINKAEKGKHGSISLNAGSSKPRLGDTENRLVVAGGRGLRMREMSECAQEVPTSSYKRSKF